MKWWKKNKKIICFDLGGTNFRWAVIDFAFDRPKFLAFEKREKPSFSQIQTTLLFYIQKAKKKYQTQKVAISSAGIVDQQQKIVWQAKQCYGKEVFSFAFLEELGWEVFLENDGRCFAQGSYIFELKRGFDPVLSLVIGTGIGGGFIWDGKNYRGQHFSGLEVGHQFFEIQGEKTDWEDLIAGKGLEKQYFLLTKQKLTAEKIFYLAQENDLTAQRVIKTAGNYFSLGLANLINLFDPQSLILGGTLVNKQSAFFLQAVKNSQELIFNQQLRIKFTGKAVNNERGRILRVFFSRLNDKASLLGAGWGMMKQEEKK